MRRCVDRYVKDLTLSPIYSKWEIVWIVSNICFWYVLMHSAYTYRVRFTIDTVHMHTQTRLKTHTHTHNHTFMAHIHTSITVSVCVCGWLCVWWTPLISYLPLWCALLFQSSQTYIESSETKRKTIILRYCASESLPSPKRCLKNCIPNGAKNSMHLIL